MRSVFRHIVRLFFPPVCAACGRSLGEGNDFVCTACMVDMPLTGFWKEKENPVVDKFAGHIPFDNACSFFYFVHEGGFRALIHSFKYQGQWKYALKTGEMFGVYLRESELYRDMDVVVPIPLHLRKKLGRGYNQAEYIARGISRSMRLPVDTASVVRHRYTKSQTLHRRSERWSNVEGIFSVYRPEKLRGKNILLVDDVLTTGATIISCAEAIVSTVPDCRISIATLAVSRNELYKPSKKVRDRDFGSISSPG